jgi:outer membrane lipoprotein SlyB
MEDAMVNYWMRAQATALDFNLIVSTNVYLSLHVTPAQTDTSGSTGEFTGGASPGYARATIARGTGTFGASAAGTITNSALAITWPEASAPWQAIVGMGLWDTLTGGSKLFYSNPLSPPTIGSGQTLRIGTSQTTLTIE